MLKFKVKELTKENEEIYLDKLLALEELVLKHMNENGKKGQLFITGREDILSYVHSKENTVMIATDEKEQVQAAVYITQGQVPFTYNDITKYFKCGERYKNYVRGTYSSVHDYRIDLLEIYKKKLEAFKSAKERILEEYPEYEGDIVKFLNHELNDEENRFHEKSELREKINIYMSNYMKQHGLEEEYNKFFWITSEDIAEEFGKSINKNQEMQEYEMFLAKFKPRIYEKSGYDESKYYGANTQNSIELDTYITNPNHRNAGLARVLVYEGIKKHIESYFENPENQEIYLCSTLHRNNSSSRYVSEFFGLKDNLYLQRRHARDREVHICRILREEILEYLEKIHEKLKEKILTRNEVLHEQEL